MWVDEVVNTIKGLGVEVDDLVVVQKVLRYLPMRFDSKISSLEEREYISTLSMDKLHGIFTAYEMRIEQENLMKKGSNFQGIQEDKEEARVKFKTKLQLQ
jgi:hypothetical protein